MTVPFVSDIIQSGVDIFKSYFPPNLTPAQKAKLEEGLRDYELKMQRSIESYGKEVAKQQGEVIKAEINSESWMAKNWRPITMLTFVFIITNNYIFYPYINLFTDGGISLTIPPDMWDLLKIGLGGYVVGRSVEKAVKNYKQKD